MRDHLIIRHLIFLLIMVRNMSLRLMLKNCNKIIIE